MFEFFLFSLFDCLFNLNKIEIIQKTAYDYCQTRELRNVFRRYMAEEPSKWNYTLAHVPSPLTPEMEKKENEKREKEKAKEKEKKKRGIILIILIL